METTLIVLLHVVANCAIVKSLQKSTFPSAYFFGFPIFKSFNHNKCELVTKSFDVKKMNF